MSSLEYQRPTHHVCLCIFAQPPQRSRGGPDLGLVALPPSTFAARRVGPGTCLQGPGVEIEGGAGLTRHFEGGSEEQLLRACTWHGRVRKVPSSAKHRGVIASPPPPPESSWYLPRCDHFSDSQYHSPLRNHLAKHFWRTQRAIARGALHL